jgi:hypothetical protein
MSGNMQGVCYMGGKKTGCLVCGADIIYGDMMEDLECYYCHETHRSKAKCQNNHYICDSCHSAPANELIARYCISSNSKDPLESALVLMENPAVKMHGPEHHFLVPAVLLMSYYNAKGDQVTKEMKIKEACTRAANILGGFCGFYGDCGAAVGTGIFVSLITGATPVSKEEWKLSNLMTAKALLVIANHGGPRCCKRNTFLALAEAAKFTRDNFGVELKISTKLKCTFSNLNHQCRKDECPFH